MKVKAFVDFINYTLLHRAELDLTTVKYLMTEFYNCLSKPELKREGTNIQMILNYTSQQLTLNESVIRAKAKNLSKELDKLKNSYEVME